MFSPRLFTRLQGIKHIRAFSFTKRVRNSLQVSEFPGAKGAPIIHTLAFETQWPHIPVYQVLDKDGKLPSGAQLPFSNQQLVKMYEMMCLLNEMDKRFYDMQRQGRISFYMTNTGEEATQIGSAAAVDNDDMIFAQYREAGVFMYRGFTMDQFANQCFSNGLDIGKGRQMPVHYGSRDLKIQTISSPLATQIPQASGAAYAYKREKNGKIVLCYFGEGAASEGDFHVALNFAATLDCPVLFICRNNGFAISTPSKEQYRGDGIAARGHGYGIATIRVDGNDLLAVYNATKAARELCISQCRPVLLEAMSYRVGHHSTSDDSSRYRPSEEIQYWHGNHNPLTRTRKLLESLSLWDDSKEFDHRRKCRDEVMGALLRAERVKKPPYGELFTDVFQELTPHLKEQKAELDAVIASNPSRYHLETYMPEPSQDVQKS